jgi:indolepyruvate ferredoxin oxidoreductase beta subunit
MATGTAAAAPVTIHDFRRSLEWALQDVFSTVGGQGTLLASDILAEVGLRIGADVKKSEVHGMSQRGGAVTSHVRWGKKIHSPLVGAGEFDVLLAFEKLEALRNVKFLRRAATVLINTRSIAPLTVITGASAYPDDDSLQKALAAVGARAEYIDGDGVAESLGNARAATHASNSVEV